MRTLLRWSLAFGVAAFAVLAARTVYSDCRIPIEELELEIESVTRGGTEVDDLSPWTDYKARDMKTRVSARGDDAVEFLMTDGINDLVEVRAGEMTSSSGGQQ